MGSNLVKALPLFQEHINKLQNLKSNQFKNLNINASSMHINKNTSEGRLNLKLNQLTKYSLNLTSAGSTTLDNKELILTTKGSLTEKSEIKNNETEVNKPFKVIDMLKKVPSKKTENIVNNTEVKNYLDNFTSFNVDIAQSQNIIYKFNNRKNNLKQNISSILENSFLTMASLISKPIYSFTHNKVVIHFSFFLFNKYLYNSKLNSKFLALNNKNIENLCANLSNLYGKPVELDLVCLKYPFHDSHILANYLGRICDINFKPYIFILDKIFNNANIKNPTTRIPESNNIIPTFLTGLKIKLAGRLLKQKIVPRRTVKTTQIGSLTRSSADLVSKSRFTTKNKRGTFSITITMGHRFY